jgi:uncharacterized membrane protein
MKNHKEMSSERVVALSEVPFAAIMVVELWPPRQFTFETLAELWTTLLSYALRYLVYRQRFP